MRGAAVVVALVAAACAPAGVAAPHEVEPELQYALELALPPGAPPALHVTVECTAAATGATVFTLGEPWGGIDDAARDVRDVHARARDATGTALVVDHAAGSAAWVVHSAGGARVELGYTLVPPHTGPSFEDRTDYHAIVDPRLVHLIGNTALLYPKALDDARPHRLTFAWRGFAEAGWRVASAYGSAAKLDLTVAVPEFRDAMFLASPELHVVTRPVPGGELDVALVNRFAFTDDALADLAAKVIVAQRGFFGDHAPSRFTITAIPIGVMVDPDKRAYGGTGLHDSFAIFLPAKFPLDGDDVTGLLGHELFHAWNGKTIMLDDSIAEGLGYWFSEGFTDFYARRLLYRAGLISVDGAIDKLNDQIGDLDRSPMRHAPNQAIAAGFWKSRDLEKLPYGRGNLVALALDREIARVSGGTRSLDDLMRELVVEARAGARVTIDGLVARFAKETSPEFAAKLRAAIVDGADVPLDAATLAPCLRGAVLTEPRFEPGFDLDASSAQHIVVGVVAGSRAAAAGLHDGDRIAHLSAELGDPTTHVVVTRADGTVVKYLPAGAPIDVRQFELGDAAACKRVL